MLNCGKILLASHGTEGAQAAEAMTLDIAAQGAEIYQLIVVPDLWKGMMGDDWLNNAKTRDTYGRYIEAQLEREILEYVGRMQEAAEARGYSHSFTLRVGKPEQCLVDASRVIDFDLVVIGSPRPKGMTGMRSRMKLETVVRALDVPLLIVPYPRTS